MSTTKIEWATKVWNPTTGCTKVSPGCKNCYAEKQHFRLMHMHPRKYTKPFLDGVESHEDELLLPYKWKKPERVFVNSMSDLFHEDVDFYFIQKVMKVIHEKPTHTFMILTKRADRMLRFFKWFDNPNLAINFPNLWLGVSVEDQTRANERIPILLQIPAAVRFLSCEPLWRAVDLGNVLMDKTNPTYANCLDGGYFLDKDTAPKIHWVIAGGESGNKARPMLPDWVRTLSDQCATAKVPFYFKLGCNWHQGTHIDFPKIIVVLNNGRS